MFVHNIKTLLPDRGAPLHAAELSAEQSVESVKMMLSPSDTGAAHHAREALLVNANGILDESEVDIGDLEDVKRKITLEDASSVKKELACCQYVKPQIIKYRMRWAITSERAFRYVSRA
jgi:hypothetical protein